MTKNSYNISAADWPQLEKRVKNLQKSLEAAGVSFTYNATERSVPSKNAINTVSSGNVPSYWFNVGLPFYKVDIEVDDDKLQDDNWEIVGVVTRQKAGITINTLWDKGVVIPEEMYSRGPDGVIECDHCRKTKAGKTQRNSGIVIHAKGTPDNPIEIKDTSRIAAEGPYENYKLIGNGCIDKYTNIPSKTVDELIRLFNSAASVEIDVGKYANISLEEIEDERFSINIKLWLLVAILITDSNTANAATRAAAICKKAHLRGIDALSQFDENKIEDAQKAVEACIEAVLEKNIKQSQDAVEFETLSNIRTLLRSEYITEKDATQKNYISILKYFFESDEFIMSPEEAMTLVLQQNKSSYYPEQTIGTPLNRLFAARNQFGSIILAYTLLFKSYVEDFLSAVDNEKAKDAIALIIAHADEIGFDITLFDTDKYFTEEELDQIQSALEAANKLKIAEYTAEQNRLAAERTQRAYGSYNIGDQIRDVECTINDVKETRNGGNALFVTTSTGERLAFFPKDGRYYLSDIGKKIYVSGKITDKDSKYYYQFKGWTVNFATVKTALSNPVSVANAPVNTDIQPGSMIDVDVISTTITNNMKQGLKDVTFNCVDGNKYRVAFFNPALRASDYKDFAANAVKHITGRVNKRYHDVWVISLAKYSR